MLIPHFLIVSIFSTATPRDASPPDIDELLLLWCMLGPEKMTAEENVVNYECGKRQAKQKDYQQTRLDPTENPKPLTHKSELVESKQ